MSEDETIVPTLTTCPDCRAEGDNTRRSREMICRACGYCFPYPEGFWRRFYANNPELAAEDGATDLGRKPER